MQIRKAAFSSVIYHIDVFMNETWLVQIGTYVEILTYIFLHFMEKYFQKSLHFSIFFHVDVLCAFWKIYEIYKGHAKPIAIHSKYFSLSFSNLLLGILDDVPLCRFFIHSKEKDSIKSTSFFRLFSFSIRSFVKRAFFRYLYAQYVVLTKHLRKANHWAAHNLWP